MKGCQSCSVLRAVVLHQGQFCPLGGIWQHVETALVVTSGVVVGEPLLSSSGGQSAAKHPTLHGTPSYNKELSCLKCQG